MTTLGPRIMRRLKAPRSPGYPASRKTLRNSVDNEAGLELSWRSHFPPSILLFPGPSRGFHLVFQKTFEIEPFSFA